MAFFSGSDQKRIVGVIHGRARRSVHDWEGTPVEALFHHEKPIEFEAALRLAKLTRKALEASYRSEQATSTDVSLQALFQYLAGSSGSSSLPLEEVAHRLGQILGKHLTQLLQEDTARISRKTQQVFLEEQCMLEDEHSRNDELVKMLRLMDRKDTNRIDFVQFARAFAVSGTAVDDERGKEGGERKQVLATGVIDSIEPQAEGVGLPQGDSNDLVEALHAMQKWQTKQFPDHCEEGDKVPAAAVPPHLTFQNTNPAEIGLLCATSDLDHAIVASGTDQQLSCFNDENPERLLSFAPRAVLLGGAYGRLSAEQQAALKRQQKAAAKEGEVAHEEYTRFYFEVRAYLPLQCSVPPASVSRTRTAYPQVHITLMRSRPSGVVPRSASKPAALIVRIARWLQVTLVSGGEGVAVGWANAHFTGNERCGVGDSTDNKHEESWALKLRDGALCITGNTLHRSDAARSWTCTPGDVIACACDLKRGELTFTHVSMRPQEDGTAMLQEVVVEVQEPEHRGSTGTSIGGVFAEVGLVPIITIDGRSQLLVNFGERPFAANLTGPKSGLPFHSVGDEPLLPVCSWAKMRREELKMLDAGPTFATLQCKDGPDACQLSRDGVMYANKHGVIPTVVFDGICLTSGCWYYEVTLIEKGQVHRSKIGWADPLLTCNGYECIGVGDDKHSWSWCPQPNDGIGKYKFPGHDGGLICHNGFREPFGPCWESQGVVGVAVDVDNGQVLFSYDGDWSGSKEGKKRKRLGLAFDNISFVGGLMPAATICGLCGQTVQFNFGDRKFKHSPPENFRGVWEWVKAYRPNQPEMYINPSLVRAKGTAALPAPDTSAACPCGRRHEGSFNGFPEPRRRDKVPTPTAAPTLVATSGAGVMHLSRGDAQGKATTKTVASATRGRPSAVLRMHPSYVGGRRYYEVRIRQLTPTAAGSLHWRVGWASRSFVGDWSRGKGIGDDSHSLGIACVLTSTATAGLLFGQRGEKRFGRVVFPNPSEDRKRRGVSDLSPRSAASGDLDLEQLGSDDMLPGAGWRAPGGGDDCAHIVFELQQPGLVASIMGANLETREYALDCCLVPPGSPYPKEDELPGSGGWQELQPKTRLGRLTAVEWKSESSADNGDDVNGGDCPAVQSVGVLASHVRLTLYGTSARPPSWAQLQVLHPTRLPLPTPT